MLVGAVEDAPAGLDEIAGVKSLLGQFDRGVVEDGDGVPVDMVDPVAAIVAIACNMIKIELVVAGIVILHVVAIKIIQHAHLFHRLRPTLGMNEIAGNRIG